MPDSRGGKSAQNEILINASAGETRVALLEQGQFTELYIERDTDTSVTGTVTLGRVTRVLPGMQAAFVDIGLDKAAFLYAGDYVGEGGEGGDEGGRRRGRNGKQPPKIDTLLREGQEIVVQVAKDPIGTKGARITSHISIAGRHLVLTPWAKRVGVSRRIDSEKERRRLRESVSKYRPKDLGFIIRTAGQGTRDADLEADIRYLTETWDDIQVKRDEVRAPADLYKELSLPLRMIRDFANSKTKRIVVDDRETYEKMNDFLTRFVADPKPVLEHYDELEPIFDHFGIEAQIDQNLGRRAWLKSGGYLIIDQSEALTAIDVNTGRFVGKANLEETVLKTNLEAVKEAVNQLRFRNIGGLIVLDLIDMESAGNRDKVYRALKDALRSDKAKTNILKISELGLVEMTRKRTRENLMQQLCEPCAYCDGKGYVLSAESVAYKVLREFRRDLPRFCGRQIAVTVHPRVAEILLGKARKAVAALGEQLGREIEVRAKPGQHQEQFELVALDQGPSIELSFPWLSDKRPEEREAEEAAAAAEAKAREAEERRAAEAEAKAEKERAAAEAKAEKERAEAEAKAAAEAEAKQAEEAAEEPAQAADDAAEAPEPAPEPDPAPGEAAAAGGDGSEPAAESEAPVEAASAAAQALAFAEEPAPEMLDAEEEKPILPRSATPEEPS